jgi:SAM-dependent methyltransferase
MSLDPRPAVLPQPLDPFAQTRDGRYCDDLVVVSRRSGVRRTDAGNAIATAHFELRRDGGRLHLAHALPVRRIDNDLTGLLSDELFLPGWVSGPELFERLLTGIVLSSHDDPLTAWEIFYRNTLARLQTLAANGAAPAPAPGSLAEFAPVYAHALQLINGADVLELGCCFGFLSLQLAAAGHRVTAVDVTPGTVRLLTRLAGRLSHDVTALSCDAARVPVADRSVDVVAAIHLLEHLDPDHGRAVLSEALRIARARVVIGVPYEDEPTAAFGHVRTVTADDLAALGAIAEADGWRAEVHDRHGGWLLLDRETIS